MSSKKVVLHFPQRLVDQPVVYKLVKQYDLEFTILKARITPREEGLLILSLAGSESSIEKGLEYLREIGVRIEPLSQDIVRDEDRCSSCGVCTPMCPTGALAIDRSTMHVDFDKSYCIACELCVKACPMRAISVTF